MKIFCIGLSRTGTTSVCEALSVLGYKTVHFSPELFLNPEVINENLHFEPKQKLNFYWSNERKKNIDYFNRIFEKNYFDKYDAFGDLPIPIYFKELDEKFPDSKFIYTYRDEEKWLKSMKWMYGDGAVMWKHGFVDDEIKFAAYDSFVFDRDKLLARYRSHHKDVLEYFSNKQDRLLYLDLDKQRVDYASICGFVCKDIPSSPFPIANKALSQSKLSRVEYWLSRNSILYSIGKKIFKKVF